MSTQTIAFIVFGLMGAVALLMFLHERRGIAQRKAARGGREVDVWKIVARGSAAGTGERTHQ